MSINLLIPASLKKSSRVGIVTLDATLREKHSFASKVPSEPIEIGSNLSDHVINQPDRISIEGFITNTPIDQNTVTSFIDFAQNAFNELTRIRENKTLISVLTYYRLYQNMIITDLTVPRTARNGQSLRFNVICTQVNIVGASSFDLFSRALSPITGAVGDARRRVNLGRQLGNNVSDDAVTSVTNILGGAV